MSSHERVSHPTSFPSDAHGKFVNMNNINPALDNPSPISPVSSESTLGPLTSSDASDAPQLSEQESVPQEETVLKKNFKLGTASIDDDRPFKVVVIGAGFSGIIAGIRFPQRMKNIDLTIYDKNTGVGGTWKTNRYPGIACDVPAHCYQLPFEAKTDWSAFYSPGPEICNDIERLVEKYQLMRYIKLQHELTCASYDETSGKWCLQLRRPVPGPTNSDFEVIEDTADFVLMCVGSLSRWTWPNIEGIESFKGKLIHSAAWETDENGSWEGSVAGWGNKNVGVIGSGSTATQIVPAIQPSVGHLYNYVRGQTWLSPPFLSDKMLELLGRDTIMGNYLFNKEDKKVLKDPLFFKNFRHELEHNMNSTHLTTIKGTDVQKNAQRAFKEHMITRLQKKPWIANHLMPDFSVRCRRLTPGPGYLEALQEDNADFIPTHINKIIETGVELTDGTVHDLDIIVCATGYDTSYLYPFKVIGRNGKSMNDRFTPHPETYISLCTDGFPNLFIIAGPNAIFAAGSLLPVFEGQVEYAIKAAQKMQREHLKSIEPKREAVRDFDEYLEHYFKTTTFSEHCRSWYKMGKAEGRVAGLWPGSCLHAIKTFKNPRWEDFDYEYLDEGDGSQNRFYWLGDGSTHNEKHMTGDRAWYLNPEELDIPPVPS